MSAPNFRGPWRVTADAGEWSASHDGNGSSAYQGVVDADGKVVAIAVAHCGSWILSPKPEAHSGLIAAAPDLLEALKLCAAVCAGETTTKGGLIQALEAARTALAKAKGEQP